MADAFALVISSRMLLCIRDETLRDVRLRLGGQRLDDMASPHDS